MNKNLVAVLDRAFPPDECPTKSGMVIKDREVAFVLVKIAEFMDDLPCGRDPDCEVCNALRTVWWDWQLSLAGPTRVRLQKVLRICDIPLPRGPWEEVPTDVVPTALI